MTTQADTQAKPLSKDKVAAYKRELESVGFGYDLKASTVKRIGLKLIATIADLEVKLAEAEAGLDTLRANAQCAMLDKIEAERALSDLRKENEWRPMDTVPPTGEFMCLAYCERYDAVCEVIRYSNRPTWYTCTANGVAEAQPTKWMPKPPPPTSGSPDNG